MNFSAAWPSSRVLTPGRILPASRFTVLTRMSPAAAIRSISSGVFLMITRSPGGPSNILLEAQRRDHRADVVVDLRGLAGSVDPAQQTLLVVVAHQRLGLLLVYAQPIADNLGLVVIAGDTPRAVLLADVITPARVELDVVVVARLDTSPPAREPLDDYLVGH